MANAMQIYIVLPRYSLFETGEFLLFIKN